ncbi:Enoyl-[acyl-carrier-protein] reductase [Minicystis rosea]|nr:Enoyl-[acyl-carrier-protein] reductase [Minicystis rosea]
MFERVVDCLERATRYPRSLLTAEADLADDLGIDSVKQVEIVVTIEAAFGIRLERAQATKAKTIADVARIVRAAVDASGSPAASSVSAPPTVAQPSPRATRVAEAARAVAAPPARAAQEPIAAPAAQMRHASDVVPSSSVRRDAGARKRFEGSGPRQLEGRIALVTGSGRGLGRTVAELLARRGATVVVNSFHSRDMGERTAAEIERLGGKAIHLWGSVANADHVDRIFDEIDQRFGGLDVLVCNASDGRIGSFLEMTSEDWDRAFRTNVVGHHACARRAASLMAVRGGGSIVTMSTVGAHDYVRGFGCQGVAKAAVEAMTRYLACELAPYNIRTNCVAAGPVYGPLLDQLAQDRETKAHWEAMTPGGALCDPLDIARAIAFLASDDAEAINGAVWSVDRGFSAHADGRLVTPGIEPLAKKLRVAP